MQKIKKTKQLDFFETDKSTKIENNQDYDTSKSDIELNSLIKEGDNFTFFKPRNKTKFFHNLPFNLIVFIGLSLNIVQIANIKANKVLHSHSQSQLLDEPRFVYHQTEEHKKLKKQALLDKSPITFEIADKDFDFLTIEEFNEIKNNITKDTLLIRETLSKYNPGNQEIVNKKLVSDNIQNQYDTINNTLLIAPSLFYFSNAEIQDMQAMKQYIIDNYKVDNTPKYEAQQSSTENKLIITKKTGDKENLNFNKDSQNNEKK